MSREVDQDGEFAYGAGLVNPLGALDPGLVYDMNETSYIQFLCREGINATVIATVVGSSEPIYCASLVAGRGREALNYPTMQLSLKRKNGTRVGVFARAVTNVGPAQSVYNAIVEAPEGVEIIVRPTTLVFSQSIQTQNFKVVVRAKPMASNQMVSGSLMWKSTRHAVRSPIVVFNPQ